ncbi:nuclease-related domain-containing protein [Pseudactinotalea suaedae]|uniref:nuclease-related domain-containing protein n=1 Tax=Pseudactinotalea suaedae TaxID=1524924 RepID=UPI001F5030F7|nr:NERD domain-containing protein/DEAD/DEAH box helicase [Pseudactinotalea suaedae]
MDDERSGPRVWPAEPKLGTASEREVWDRLRAQLPDDAHLIGNLRLSEEEKNHEIDFLVLLPRRGVIALEVKGAGIGWRAEHGWSMTHRGRISSIDPVEQIRSAMYAARHRVRMDPRWGSRPQLPWAHGVVTPFTEFGPDFDLSDLQRWMLHDRGDQDQLAARLADQLDRTRHAGTELPYGDDLDVVAEILTRPRVMVEDPLSDSEERAAVADQLTMEQAVLLGATRLLRRVEVRGGAGSGKTVLALQQAKELTRGGGGRSGERVALLCYSIGLAQHLKRVVKAWSWRERPAFVGTFHEFGTQWGAPTGTRQDSDFWETELPVEMARLAAELPASKRYDSIVVDEAQDSRTRGGPRC